METLLKGTQYDTGLRVTTGDFTLHLDHLTSGTYQHVIIKIDYTLHEEHKTLTSKAVDKQKIK